MILFSLVINKNQEILKRLEFRFLLVSLLCMLFGAVYEHFSHEVYSGYMLYAFVIPLVGGTFVTFLLDHFSKKTMPGKTVFFLYSAGIATLTVGSIFEGVLEIYGTTNHLIIVYPVVGFCLLLSSIIAYTIGVLYVRRNFE